jgi:hypothetical protein
MGGLGIGVGAFRLPGDDTAGEVRPVRIAPVLGDERGGDRAVTGAAGKYYLLALRIGNGSGIEARQRHDHRFGIAFRRDLIWLAHID